MEGIATVKGRERVLCCIAMAVTVAAQAAPRAAVHPLGVAGVTAAQAEQLSARFEVMLAKLEGVTLAGTSRLDEALGNNAASNCEGRDSCLRFLAEATDCLYGVYARVDVKDTAIVATGRVVRVDGAVMRRVSVPATAATGHAVVDTARQALVQLLAELKLNALEDTLPLPVETDTPLLTPPPMPAAAVDAQPQAPVEVTERRRAPWQRATGWSLVGVGGAGFVVGGVFAGLAATGAASNPHDAAGRVSPEHAAGAATALKQGQIATVLLPVGAALAVIGAVVLAVPGGRATGPLQVAMVPEPGRFTVSLGGRF